MSTRFSVTDVPGDRPLVLKRGDPAAIARESEALRILEGRSWTPSLVEGGPGWMVSTRMPGSPRPIAGIGASEAQRLGAVVRELHGLRRAATGGLPSWDRPADGLAAYRRARAHDTERMLAGGPDGDLALRLAERVPGPAEDDPEPFRMIHGDLVESNLVWGPEGPALIDWEFWRMGDPAEDLAYLVEVNGLPADVTAALIEGYALPGMAPRVRAWRALAALDAGAWYAVDGQPDAAATLLARARSLA